MHYTNYFPPGTPSSYKRANVKNNIRFEAEMVGDRLELRLVVDRQVMVLDHLDPSLLIPGKKNLGEKFKASDLVTFVKEDENCGVFWYNTRKYNFSLLKIKNRIRREAPHIFSK